MKMRTHEEYQWIVDETEKTLGIIGIRFDRGVIVHPYQPRCLTLELVNEVRVTRRMMDLKPLPKMEVRDYIIFKCGESFYKQFKKEVV